MSNAFHATPDWVRDAVFYQVFPDRFAKSERLAKPRHLEAWDSPPTLHGYKGGDLLGVCERLDYLAELGITALYLNPIFQSASNHRYHTHDYLRVDPLLGGDAAFFELLARAHERGLKVVIDGVFNHASRGFLQFNDILENGPASAYLDWFHVNRFPLHAYGGGDLGYAAWWGIPALPKFNTATPAVREYLLGVAEYWLRAGADGWRLDVPNEIDDPGFWREFRSRCRDVDPEAYLVGEIWHGAEEWLQGDRFDGVMNYPLTRAIFGLVAAGLAEHELVKSGLGAIARLDAGGFVASVQQLLERYREEAVFGQLNLLGSHDTPRLATSLCGDERAVRQALLALFALPGAPCVYYGDEIGLTGGHDPHCRQAMPWSYPEGWDHELKDYVSSLARARAGQAALRRGGTRLAAAGSDVVLIERTLADEVGSVTAVINIASEARQVPAELLFENAYRDLISGEVIAFTAGVPRQVAGAAALLLVPA